MSLRRELDREAKKKTDREKPDTKREPFLEVTQLKKMDHPYQPKQVAGGASINPQSDISCMKEPLSLNVN
jgi:hypothetical protein